ncbi:MAG: hypothetical protein OXC79_12570 [Candidatus Poribacteria bacterium]|nr:hypothetical protein [Candidatus Poribacteria bacterium]
MKFIGGVDARIQKKTEAETEGAVHNAFALVAQLKHQFKQRGITEADCWKAIKLDLGVESRSEIDELGYVVLAARLQTAKKHRHMFESLCHEIKAK